MNMLKAILENTKKEIAKKKILKPVEDLIPPNNREKKNFRDIFKKGAISLIAEIKKASPLTGKIIDELNIEKIALIYESSGVDAISVVSNERFFGGSIDYIKSVKSVTSLPVLRKDFIIDEYQIYESWATGADAILLIAGILKQKELKEFVNLSNKLLMSPVIEVHTVDDLKRALNTDTKIIGINNRNLKNFQVDINTSLRLVPMIPDGYYTVSESGIKTRRDVIRLKDAGFDGILVGTSILKSKNMVKKIKELKWID